MAEWWSYSLADFLLFAPRAYYGMIERYNRDVWPLHLVAVTFAAPVAIAIARPGDGRIRLAAAGLAVAWAWIAWAFMWERYVTINWAATWPAAAFALQALLLLLFAVSGPKVTGVASGTFARRGGVVVFLLVAVFYPFLAPVTGRGWQTAEIIFMTPDPTAVATLAWLTTAAQGWRRGCLAVVPALWVTITAATLWTLGSPDFFVAPAAALAALAIASIYGRARDTLGAKTTEPGLRR